MNSRERIKRTFDFKLPDRVGMADDFTETALKKWAAEGRLPKTEKPEEYFGFDIRLFGFDQDFNPAGKNMITADRLNKSSSGECIKTSYEEAKSRGRFLVLSCMEPFGHISAAVGMEKTLAMMAEDPAKTASLFAASAEFTLKTCQLALDKEYAFDGAWLWGDFGSKDGIIFSTDYYKRFLFGLHKEFCGFFADNGMPVIFHSDGNITELLPCLIKAGIRAIEPLESNVGMDLERIKKEYGRDIVLFGGIDEQAFKDTDRAEREIKRKFAVLVKNGGYIYHADSPISEEISFDNYKKALELARNYGAY